VAAYIFGVAWTGVTAAESTAWPEGWAPLWTRDTDAGRAVVERPAAGGKPPAFRIEHTGARDWSLATDRRIPVRPGDRFILTARVKVQGKGSATLGVILYGADGNALDWSYGGRTVHATGDRQTLRSRFAVPYGAKAILPRVLGSGPATVWVDSFGIERDGRIDAMADRAAPPEQVTVENPRLAVTFTRPDGALTAAQKPGGRTWRQHDGRGRLVVVAATADGRQITFEWLDPETGLDGRGEIVLDDEAAEFTVTLDADGDLRRPLAFPSAFTAEALAPKGETPDGRQPPYLVIPMNEGISYPVDDESITPMRLVAYGGHGICMGFWGVTDGEAGHMAVIETADDAAIRISRAAGRLVVAPEWDAQRGRFGYPRRLRYVFFDKGGHVAMCKRYRAYAKSIGRFRTLAEKREACPAVDLLVGAVNVWNWDRDAVGLVREMQEAGIRRILWSRRQPPDAIRAMNAMPGVLTSRYDIYQDVMNPENFTHLRGVHGDWPTDMWPDGLNLDVRGQWRRGWRVRGKDGTMYPCGVLCDLLAPDLARKRIGGELRDHPYRSRFIDTTTASPWRECHHPDHPMTRTESRKAKMDLLRVVSGEFGLVCGSETGHDAAVPVVHYFEGMLSLGPYRVPDAGRNMARIVDEVPERVAKFQVGHRYRLPLWELVYHDCVVAQWYWGDYNNKLPALWDKRDLFNALYGTPPMFLFRRPFWNEHRKRFVRSYEATAPVARATGYREMLDHRFLTPDRDVQQTRFAGGVTVTVNFGDEPYLLPDGTRLAPMTSRVTGLP
jgi:hypothetical protein